MTDAQLLERVRELRHDGWSPKQIARTLGLPPAAVSPLVRRVAEEQATTDRLPPLVGCWVNRGWNLGIEVGAHRDWPLAEYPLEEGEGGLSGVLVAREHRYGRVSVCGYLLDVWCLGVKNALGPKTMDSFALSRFVDAYFDAYGGGAVEVPIEVAQHLVFGAADYARGLGFEPHRDFRRARGHLGTFDRPSDIVFGKDGRPFFVQGPYDDVDRVMGTLRRTVGEGNFRFICALS